MASFPIWLVPIGFLVGTLGTLVGAGGGFILLPLLVFLYPKASPDAVTSISMSVIFFNALSGTLAYARMRRIDYQAGAIFTAAGFPGAYLGAISTQYIPRQWFDLLVGFCLVAIALFLLWRAASRNKFDQAMLKHETGSDSAATARRRQLIRGAWLSAGVGYLSSLIGIGGGIIHVPALVYMLNFPVHAATATSHFVLTGTSFVAMATHVASGALTTTWPLVLMLATGVVLGAQVGARLSRRVHGVWIIRGLSAALMIAGLRIAVRSIF